MLKNTLLALTLIGCASADTVKEQAKTIDALSKEIDGLKNELGLKQDKETGKEDAKAEEGEEGKKKAAKKKTASERIKALEAKVLALQAGGGKGRRGNQMSAEDQQKIQTIMKAAQSLQNEGKNKEAAEKLKEVIKISPQMGRRINAMITEIEVVGSDAPKSFTVSKWLSGEKDGAKIDFGKGVTFVVFWELWCPHCKKHMPKLVKTYADLKGKGLNLVGLTQLSKGKSEAEVTEYLGKHKITYPVGVHDGAINKTFAVGGIPAAALVKDGKIVWRGHPARLTDKELIKHLEG